MTKSTGVGQGVGGGAPTKYRAEYAKRVFGYCLLGATDKQIADFFEVEESTINNWKKEHPKFLESIRKARFDADHQVVMSLYKRATGYKQKKTVVTAYQGMVEKVKVDEEVIPDVRAAEVWLRNRRPNEWREQSEQKIIHEYEEMTDEQLEKLIESRKDTASQGA